MGCTRTLRGTTRNRSADPHLAPLAFFVLLISIAPFSRFFFGIGTTLFTTIGGDIEQFAVGQQLMRFWEWLRW